METSAPVEVFAFTVGDFRCTAIRDALDGNRNVLLVKAGQQNVLIDTGVGRDQATVPATLLDRMARLGTPAADIDIVILSHADFDHIGGTIDGGRLAFPNARYVLHRKEAEFWAARPDRLPPRDAYAEDFRRRGNDLPVLRLAQLQDRLELVDDGHEIVPGIRMIAAPGHTPGYTVIALASDGAQFLFVGDLLYDPANIEDPDWVAIYDFDPVTVVATRRLILERAARDNALLMAYHLPFPGLGHVSARARGWTWHSLDARD